MRLEKSRKVASAAALGFGDIDRRRLAVRLCTKVATTACYAHPSPERFPIQFKLFFTQNSFGKYSMRARISGQGAVFEVGKNLVGGVPKT